MFPRRGWINFHASSVYTYKLYYLLESHVDRRLGGLLQTSRYLSGGVWSCVRRIALPMTRARGMRVGKSKGYNGVRSENAMPSQNHIGLYFYRASSYASAVLAVVIVSVCPSVCLSVWHTHAYWQNQTMHCGYFNITISLVFWHQQRLAGDASSVWNLRSQGTHPLRKTPTSTDFSLWRLNRKRMEKKFNYDE